MSSQQNNAQYTGVQTNPLSTKSTPVISAQAIGDYSNKKGYEAVGKGLQAVQKHIQQNDEVLYSLEADKLSYKIAQEEQEYKRVLSTLSDEDGLGMVTLADGTKKDHQTYISETYADRKASLESLQKKYAYPWLKNTHTNIAVESAKGRLGESQVADSIKSGVDYSNIKLVKAVDTIVNSKLPLSIKIADTIKAISGASIPEQGRQTLINQKVSQMVENHNNKYDLEVAELENKLRQGHLNPDEQYVITHDIAKKRHEQASEMGALSEQYSDTPLVKSIINQDEDALKQTALKLDISSTNQKNEATLSKLNAYADSAVRRLHELTDLDLAGSKEFAAQQAVVEKYLANPTIPESEKVRIREVVRKASETRSVSLMILANNGDPTQIDLDKVPIGVRGDFLRFKNTYIKNVEAEQNRQASQYNKLNNATYLANTSAYLSHPEQEELLGVFGGDAAALSKFLSATGNMGITKQKLDNDLRPILLLPKEQVAGAVAKYFYKNGFNPSSQLAQTYVQDTFKLMGLQEDDAMALSTVHTSSDLKHILNVGINYKKAIQDLVALQGTGSRYDDLKKYALDWVKTNSDANVLSAFSGRELIYALASEITNGGSIDTLNKEKIWSHLDEYTKTRAIASNEKSRVERTTLLDRRPTALQQFSNIGTSQIGLVQRSNQPPAINLILNGINSFAKQAGVNIEVTSAARLHWEKGSTQHNKDGMVAFDLTFHKNDHLKMGGNFLAGTPLDYSKSLGTREQAVVQLAAVFDGASKYSQGYDIFYGGKRAQEPLVDAYMALAEGKIDYRNLAGKISPQQFARLVSISQQHPPKREVDNKSPHFHVGIKLKR